MDMLNKRAMTFAHRVALLRTMSAILDQQRDSIPEATGKEIIKFAATEMTSSRDVQSDPQGAASTILVTMGMRLPEQLMDEMLKRFGSGQVPHFFVMKTLADFAAANALYFVPKLKQVRRASSSSRPRGIPTTLRSTHTLPFFPATLCLSPVHCPPPPPPFARSLPVSSLSWPV